MVEMEKKKKSEVVKWGNWGNWGNGDERNILVLLFLYILQGIPLGLAGAIPFILTQRGASYGEQAAFSFSIWPFSIKLLWAPIVDSIYSQRFGRRKTWLIPIQYLIGITLIWLSFNVERYLENISVLTALFFLLNFLAATQDIAVDGWALTMLKSENVGYASTCNSVGQTAGYFLGYVGYIGLESLGWVTLPGFMFFWGILFFGATTLVGYFKKENSEKDENNGEEEGGILETYGLLYKILRLPLMPSIIIVLLTGKIGFSATDSVTSLKLIEAGVPKEKLAMLAIPMIPVQILMPLIISRYTAGPKPMNVFLKAMPIRLIFGLIFASLVFYTPTFADPLDKSSFPWYYYGLILIIYAVHQVFTNCMFVAIMAFFSRIADPCVGGTYMTLLNTLCNLGGNWPATAALWMVDFLTIKECTNVPTNSTLNESLKIPEGPLSCYGKETECHKYGGTCVTIKEGYYLETIVCVVFGFVWLYAWGLKTIRRLQDAELSEWRVVKTDKIK